MFSTVVLDTGSRDEPVSRDHLSSDGRDAEDDDETAVIGVDDILS